MNQTVCKKNNSLNAMYEEPQMDIVYFSCADIITTSGNGDDNQGEWDPQ